MMGCLSAILNMFFKTKKAMGKPFRWMFRCVKPQKEEDDCPGLPQPQVTDAEEASPETLPAESLSSLTDKEAGPCPTEADPGPKADRVPEPQGRPSDEKPSDRVFDEDAFNFSPTRENVHKICKMFPKCSIVEEKWKFADTAAVKHLDLILEHFLESQKTVCDQLMYFVLASPKCNREACMNEFILKVNEYQTEDSEEFPLAKVKALKGIRALVSDLSNLKNMMYWLQNHLLTLISILVSQSQLKEKGSSGKLKKYIVPGEAIDILAFLLQRLDLM